MSTPAHKPGTPLATVRANAEGRRRSALMKLEEADRAMQAAAELNAEAEKWERAAAVLEAAEKGSS